MTKKY